MSFHHSLHENVLETQNLDLVFEINVLSQMVCLPDSLYELATSVHFVN